MKKFTLVFLTLTMCAMVGFGQRANQKWFSTAMGMRVEGGAGTGGTMGVTYERALGAKTHFDFFVLTDFSYGVEADVLYKFVNSIPDVPGSVRWFVGFGAHAGIWGQNSYDVGPDGILGIGYVFSEFPANITIDWHPSVDVLGGNFNAAKFGFSFRYVVQ
ncbi:MAG: hypothetical protein R6U95_04640 [Bacteroidales bacterium]